MPKPCRRQTEREGCARLADPENEGGWCCDPCYMAPLRERGVEPYASWPEHHPDCKEINMPDATEMNVTQKCATCGQQYPSPVEYHHDEAECALNVASVRVPHPFRDILAALLRERGYTHNEDDSDDYWYGPTLGVRPLMVCIQWEMDRDLAGRERNIPKPSEPQPVHTYPHV